jgi:hypothetical protein
MCRATPQCQFGSYLHAGDPEAAAGQREGGLAGGAADLQEPVTGAEVRPVGQFVVQLSRVAGPCLLIKPGRRVEGDFQPVPISHHDAIIASVRAGPPGYAGRRRGLAGTLVCHAARHVLDTAGASTLVMVADPADSAIRVYRAVGFADAETQIGFERPPPADGDG